MEEQRLSNGWKVSQPYSTQRNAEYVKRMTEELIAAGHPPPKAIPIFASEEEKQAHIFKMQPQSTRDALERQKNRKPEDDLDFILRPMPDCLANPDAKSKDDLVGKREIDALDVILMEANRRSVKNELGSSKESSVKDKRDSGIHAFTYSKPYDATLEEIKKIKKITEIEAISPEFSPKEEEKEREPLIERIIARIRNWQFWWW